MCGYLSYNGDTIRVCGPENWQVGTARDDSGVYYVFTSFPSLEDAQRFIDNDKTIQ